MTPMKPLPNRSKDHGTLVVLLVCCVVAWFTENGDEVTFRHGAVKTASMGNTSPSDVSERATPAWSTVKPANHGTNPIPEGFVQTAVYEDVARLAFPTPAPVAAGLRARVLLGEISGATGRHKYVRIEEVANIKENRLVERRVMPADHLVAYVQKGKTEEQLTAALPSGFSVRKKLSGGQRYLIGFESKDVDSMEQASAALKKLPILASAVPDGYIFSASIPNDPLFDQQWGLHNTGQTVNGIAGTPDADIDAPEAWDLTTGSSAVTVAVIDSGIDLTHEDLVDNIWKNPGESGGGKETNGIDDDGNGFIDDVNGWDFVNDDKVPQDDFGHGTHVAGIIGAKGNNGVGIAGVCWNVKLASLKALRANGSGLWSDVTEAIEYAKLQNLGTVNLSLGAYGSAPLGVQTLMEEADTLLFCAAAGNGAIGTGGVRAGDNLDFIPFSPASLLLGNVISVGAVGADGQFGDFSNFGKVGVDIGAPGVNILSTKTGGGYELKSGTSMASAFVSGAAAMCRARSKRGALETREMLQSCPDRSPRLEEHCVVAGRLWLDRVAIQAIMNIRWRHIANTSSGLQHILPDGQLRNINKGGGFSPSVDFLDNKALTFQGSDFDIDTTLKLRGLRTSIAAAGHKPELYAAFSTGGVHFSPVIGGDNVVCVSSAQTGTNVPAAWLMLKRDGSVWSFGTHDSWTGHQAPPYSAAPIPAPLAGLSDIIQIESMEGGNNHFALNEAGVLFSFGENDTGQLGTGSSSPVPTPLAVQGLPPVREFFIVAGNIFCVGYNSDVWGWGNNNHALGLAQNSTPVSAPIRLPAWDGCVSFGPGNNAGPTSTIAARSDGRVLVCYSGPPGGNGSIAGIPQVVAGLENFERAPSYELGSDRRGRLWEWGQAKLSRSLEDLYNFSATQVPAPAPVFDQVKIPINSVAIALLSDGRTQTWGVNSYGSLGNGFSSTYLVPMEIPELHGISGLSGNSFSSSYVFTWNASGGIRTVGGVGGSILQQDFPTISGISQGVAGTGRFEVLKGDGKVWTYDKQAHFSSGVPIVQSWQQTAFSDVRFLFTGGTYILCAVDTQNRIWAQNSLFFSDHTPINITGILPAEFTAPVSGEIGGDGIVMLCVDGKVWTFQSFANQVAPGVTLASQGLRLLADMGPGASMAWPSVLKSDGSVWTFSNNANSITEVTALNPPGQTLAPIIKMVRISNDPTFAVLRADGTIWTWGNGTYLGRGYSSGTYQPGLLETLADAVDIFSTNYRAYAKRIDGSIWGWGLNTGGELGSKAYAGTPVETLNYSISTEVHNSGLGINDWLYTHFSKSEIGSINISGDEADPDRDGLVNLVEYALGSNPKVASDGEGEEIGLTASFETVSSEALSADGDGASEEGELHFTVKLKRRAKRPGIEYRVEFSDDMVTWYSSPDRLIKVLESERVVIYRDVAPLGVAAKRYARLAIRKGN